MQGLLIILRNSLSFAKKTLFIQEHRERIIGGEEGVKAVNKNIYSLDKRIKDLKSLM